MKKLRVSSPLDLHSNSRENLSEYIRTGLEFHKEIGFDAADFDMSWLDLSSDASWRPSVEKALEDSEKVGLKIEICHLPFIGGGVKDPSFLEKFNEKMHRAIDAATLLGVSYAVLHPNAPTVSMKSYDRAKQHETVMTHLAPFAEHAARVGLNIVVENMRVIPTFVASHRYCQSPDELCDVADALGIGVCWDFGHANISGIKQSEGIAYVGKRLKVLHVNDNAAVDDEHIPPFMGNVNWRDAMHGLALVGFDGLLNYEIATDRLPAVVRKAHAKYLIDAAEELMSYIK